MTYQVKIETKAGDLETYGPTFTDKAKAIRMARYAARNTVISDASRFHVDCIETDMAVFTAAVR
jgi:hypothetical protein